MQEKNVVGNPESVFGKGPDITAERALVVEINDEKQTAIVQLQEVAACKDCGASNVCHPSGGDRPKIEIDNPVHAGIGDLIELQTPELSKIGATLIVFGLPILFLVIGAVTGSIYGTSTDDIAVGAIAGLALGVLLVRLANTIAKRGKTFMPIASKIVSKANQSCATDVPGFGKKAEEE